MKVISLFVLLIILFSSVCTSILVSAGKQGVFDLPPRLLDGDSQHNLHSQDHDRNRASTNNHNHQGGGGGGCLMENPTVEAKIHERMFDKSRPRPTNENVESSEAFRRRRASGDNTNTTDPDSLFEPIRMTASFLDLYDPNKYCQYAGQYRSDFLGEMRQCRADEVFTPAKRTLLETVIVPYAIAKIQKMLRVKRITSGPLRVGATDQCYQGFTIPQSHVSEGLSETDYVLYISAGTVEENVVAWAGGCQLSTEDPVPRIIVGRTLFNAKFLNVANMPTLNMLRTFLHEIIHAVGMTHSYMKAIGMVETVTIRGKIKQGITSPMALQTARAFFNCSDLVAVSLEDEGSSGTTSSHLDKRTFPNSIMGGTVGPTLSIFELAILEDMQVYRSNFSEAEPLYYGRDAGCEFVTSESCPTTIAGSGISKRLLYCDSDNTPVTFCTSSLEGYGPCGNAFLTDGCRQYSPYSDARCIHVEVYGNRTDYGESFHVDSRCYETTGFFQPTGGSLNPSWTQRCIQSRCEYDPVNDSVVLEFRVGDQETWNLCTTANAFVTVPGHQGQVRCPSNLHEMCASILGTTNRKMMVKSSAVPDVTLWSVTPAPPDAFTTPSPVDRAAGAGKFEFVSVSSILLIVLFVFF